MRRLITLSILSLIVLTVSVPVMALDFDARSYYGQGTLVLPMGDMGDWAGMGFGACFGVRVPHTEQLTFRGEIGYIMFGGKDFGWFDYSVNFIPIMALGEYHWNLDSPMYAIGGLGFTRVSIDMEYTGILANIPDEDSSDLEITICGGVGYEVNEQFSIEGRYSIISDANSFSVVGVYYF